MAIETISTFKLIIAGLFLFTLMYGLLYKLKPLGENSIINLSISILATILVSFTGILTYVIQFGLNIFLIILLVLFFIMILLLFMGIDFKEIGSLATKNSKVIMIVLVILFLGVLVKGFFTSNNQFDYPKNDSLQVNSTANFGFEKDTQKYIQENSQDSEGFKISDFWLILFFFIVLGASVLFLK